MVNRSVLFFQSWLEKHCLLSYRPIDRNKLSPGEATFFSLMSLPDVTVVAHHTPNFLCHFGLPYL